MESDRNATAGPGRLKLVGAYAAASLVLCGLAFGPHLAGDFVWDDVPLVQKNPHLRDRGGLRRIVTSDLWGGATDRPGQLYHPLPMLTFWLQAQITGITMLPFRVVNVAAHACCGLLLLLWLRREQLSPAGALGISLIFLVHPSVTEPVMWLTGRHDTLATLCCLGALLVWPARVERRRVLRSLSAGLLCAAACLCKEPYLVMPALLACYEAVALAGPSLAGAVSVPRAPTNHLSPARIVLLLPPVAGVAAVFAVRRLLGIHAGSDQLRATLGEHFVNYASIVAHYARQLLSLDNGPTIASYQPLPANSATLVLLATALAFGLALLALRRRASSGPALFLGVVWFLLALLPLVVSLPVTGLWANRYAYFPLIGLSLAVGLPLARLTSRWSARLRRIGGVCLAAGLVALALSTGAEARNWSDDLSLYGADLARAPRDGAVLYHFGHAVNRRQGCRAALPYFVEATRRAPHYGRAWHNVAGCLINLGQYAEAVTPAERALRLAPGDARREYNLGVALVLSGQVSRGIDHLERSVRLDPGHIRAREMLARARSGRPPPLAGRQTEGSGD